MKKLVVEVQEESFEELRQALEQVRGTWAAGGGERVIRAGLSALRREEARRAYKAHHMRKVRAKAARKRPRKRGL